MAPVEIGYYTDTFNSQGRLIRRTIREQSTARGNIYRSQFLSPTKILVSCHPQDNSGTIMLRERQFVDVWIYENEDDLEGRHVRTGKPIKFFGDQEVEIWSNHKRRLVIVWHEKNDDESQQSVPKTPELITV